jgi:hypothetical protein
MFEMAFNHFFSSADWITVNDMNDREQFQFYS